MSNKTGKFSAASVHLDGTLFYCCKIRYKVCSNCYNNHARSDNPNIILRNTELVPVPTEILLNRMDFWHSHVYSSRTNLVTPSLENPNVLVLPCINVPIATKAGLELIWNKFFWICWIFYTYLVWRDRKDQWLFIHSIDATSKYKWSNLMLTLAHLLFLIKEKKKKRKEKPHTSLGRTSEDLWSNLNFGKVTNYGPPLSLNKWKLPNIIPGGRFGGNGLHNRLLYFLGRVFLTSPRKASFQG